MEQRFTEQSLIGDIVAEIPKAADLLKAHRIDFCCGGQRPLKEAIEELGLDGEALLRELNALYAEAQNKPAGNWSEAPLADLVDHIINTHHRYLNEELPQLSP
ncbi:DUF542 domain-containing protein, partial [Geobacillus stearothermophilus]|uniref:DUF542 domain-containing protein n=1 Tax=Geobacillus stearothermophilus TaxID=1422 RepID=UPI003D228649